jgi:hypothetical protein
MFIILSLKDKIGTKYEIPNPTPSAPAELSI